MAAEIPTFEPDKITAGDTACWKRYLKDYPAGDGWALSYALVRRESGEQIRFVATADGDGHLVNVPANGTAAWLPGDYAGQGYVTNGEDRFQVWDGLLSILPNYAGGNVGDVRTHARKVLDAIQAVLENRATQQVLEFTVEGTVLRKASVADLLMLRDRYTVVVRKEEERARARAGKATGRRILTQFVKPDYRGGWPPGVIRG